MPSVLLCCIGPFSSCFSLNRAAKERITEEVDDAQDNDNGQHGGSQSPSEGNGRSMNVQPWPSQSHVHLYGLHLEVCATDPTQMEQLVAVACRGQWEQVVGAVKTHDDVEAQNNRRNQNEFYWPNKVTLIRNLT